MKLDELFGFLRMFVLSLEDNVSKKKSGISFQGVWDDIIKSRQNCPQDENLVETIVLLSKFKNKFYKKFKGYGSHSNKEFNKSSSSGIGSTSS